MKFIVIVVLGVLSVIGSSQAFQSTERFTITTNDDAQRLCKHWVDKVERNAGIVSGWLVRHTSGLSANKLGDDYTYYSKIFDHTTGDHYRSLLVQLGWDLRDTNYAVARHPNISVDAKARKCEQEGMQANAAVINLYDSLNPNGSIP